MIFGLSLAQVYNLINAVFAILLIVIIIFDIIDGVRYHICIRDRLYVDAQYAAFLIIMTIIVNTMNAYK